MATGAKRSTKIQMAMLCLAVMVMVASVSAAQTEKCDISACVKALLRIRSPPLSGKIECCENLVAKDKDCACQLRKLIPLFMVGKNFNADDCVPAYVCKN